MQKQKIIIQYKADESVSDFGFNRCEKTPPDNRSIFLNLQNSSLNKRNKVQAKAKDLEKIIFRHKVDRLVTNYIKKIRLNSVYRKPVEFQEQNQKVENQKNHTQNSFCSKMGKLKEQFSQKKGLHINNLGLIIWSFINLLQITLMVFVQCLMLTFPETIDSPVCFYFRVASIILYLLDIILNFTVKRYKGGKYLEKIGQISSDYFRKGFAVDIINLAIFPIDIISQITAQTNLTILIFLVSFLKLINNMRRFQKLQHLMINSQTKEHYFGLLKVFLTNFAIGHILSILLNLMATIDEKTNWQIKLGIFNSEWYIKYAWGYYWGTNIMLTVGFGDICASNYYEAIILVFIETISCITLAYNINNVGALISSIRQGKQEKKRKLKIFHRMCQQNFIKNDIQSKVANFIEEQYKIKEEFEYDAHDIILKSLPKTYEIQIRKQANKTLFDNIGFLNNLSKKSFLKLAEVICRKICHPQQIVLTKGGISHFTILQKGSLSLTCKIRSRLDGVEIQSICINEGEKPKILSLDFIKNKILNYNIKSKNYSILYYLSREETMEALRGSQMDFQMFCQLKDKDEKEIDQNNLYICTVCKDEYHSKFDCSRLHYTPLKRKVILNHICVENKIKQKREERFARKKLVICPLLNQDELSFDQKRYVNENFDEDHCRQIQKLIKFYERLGSTLTSHQETTLYYNNKKNPSQLKTGQNVFIEGIRNNDYLNNLALNKIQQLIQNKANKIYNTWDFEIDQAQNYNFYFRQGNPELLKKGKKAKKNKGFFNIYSQK